MQSLPPPIQNLLNHFNRLPGVGQKTALRYVFYLLKRPKEELSKFAEALHVVKNSISECEVCCGLSDDRICGICGDIRRDKNLICIVSDEEDRNAIENTSEFKGVYHILGGIINPLEGITPDHLKIAELLQRISSPTPPREIILAFNPTIEGETTILYLTSLLKKYNIKATRLARGLPVGSELEYADEITLTDALKERKEVT
ncbi:MAG: recombination protein RecR [Parcubacteria group bacterium]|nr:recombination protein RecR [Parcubacteria group bacterium]